MAGVESSVLYKRVYSSPSDVISDLPDGILENILTRLPLRDAVRTSVLSKRWRFSWEAVEDLVFDDALSEELPQDRRPDRILLIIYQVLHKIKTVRKFSITCYPVRSCPELDNIIIGLSRRQQIEEFTLRVGMGQAYSLPRCLFSYEKLSHLDLYNCVFSYLPATFRGYSMLVSLELVQVLINEESFVKMISSCPLLEILRFETCECTAYGHIQIDKPGLKMARFVGIFKSVTFKNASHLASVGILSRWPAFEVQVYKENIFFSDLPALKDLAMCGHYMMSLSPTVLKFPSPGHLKYLNLHMVCLDDQRQNDLALWLILSAKLESLRIQVCYSDEINHPGLKYLDKWRDVYLENLRDVYVDNAFGSVTEIEFIKIMLTRSPVLEKMVIKPQTQVLDRGFRMLQELSGCERLSPKAKVFL